MTVQPPPGYVAVDAARDTLARRRQIRGALRHPLELFTLVVAILASAVILAVGVNAFIDAVIQQRTPNTYATILVLAPVLLWFLRGQLLAKLRVNGVKITPTQYPEAYAMVAEAAREFGLSRVPDAYVVLGNGMINAAASGHGFRRFIFVYSDLFEVGGRLRNPDALRFVIAHEVGHIAAGHASYWRWLGIFASNWIPLIGPALSRSQEYTADNFGYAHCPHGSASAMATLAAGKYLNASIDINAIADRAEQEKGFFVWTVNAAASHPVLAWRAHALRDRSAPGRLLWRPQGPTSLAPPPDYPHLTPGPPR
jgi:Zn-dependent protease with chaperone function